MCGCEEELNAVRLFNQTCWTARSDLLLFSFWRKLPYVIIVVCLIPQFVKQHYAHIKVFSG